MLFGWFPLDLLFQTFQRVFTFRPFPVSGRLRSAWLRRRCFDHPPHTHTHTHTQKHKTQTSINLLVAVFSFLLILLNQPKFLIEHPIKFGTMRSLRYTRNLFVRCFCVVYLFSFVSFYIQIPGLYGDNGILPAKSLLENTKHKTFAAKIHYQPTLLWLTPYLGLDTAYALDVLALLGAFLAFTGFISQKFCTAPLFAALWSLYFSLYQVGQVFVSSNYDDLLLEAGLLALLVAPLWPGKKGSKGSPADQVSFWAVRWLVFRFLLTSGLTKLISGCPKWWNLSAFDYYFESQPLPSPLAWYFHQVPSVHLKLFAVFANICELALPFFFFVPFRIVRITAFVIQMWLQIWIVLTGNYNFLNLLMVTLLLSLLDDQFFYGKKKSSTKWAVFEYSINIVAYAALAAAVYALYSLKLNGNVLESNIAFTKDQFDGVLKVGITYTLFLALASLVLTILRSLSNVLSQDSGKLWGIISLTVCGSIAVVLLAASSVPLASLHPAPNSTIVHPTTRNIYNRIHKIRAVNQYGLFKKMVGVDGRPEIIFEGSDNVEGPWLEYNFLYKPGNVNHSLPFVAPYTPRLDWQLYWAAYSTYEKEPWIWSLAHRMLNNRPEVLTLLDKHHSPFSKKAPKYVRASLYKYKYTKWSERSGEAWWSRQKVGEYFPAFTKDSPALLDYLKARNLLPTASKQTVNPIWKQALDAIRYVTGHLEATLLLWSVFTAGCAIITTSAKK